MSAPGSPSLLARLRGTPGSLRRKFRKAQSLNLNTVQLDTPLSSPTVDNTFKPNHSSRKHEENGNRPPPFTCRFLGMMSIYTLHPEHCYGFAEELAKSASEGEGKEVNNNCPVNKCQILVKEQSLEISPVDKRQHHKRKPLTVGSPPLRQKNFGGSTNTLHYQKSVHGRSRAVSCEEVLPEESKRESPTVFRDTAQISVFAPPVYTRDGRAQPTTVFRFPERTTSKYGRNLSAMPEQCQENFAATIPLHDVAYCVTVPSNTRLFLLTSRQGPCLVCRVFLFSRREKAQAITLALANQFKKSYLDWQSGKNNKRKASLSRERRAAAAAKEANAAYLSASATTLPTVMLRSRSSGEAENQEPDSDPNKDSGHEDVYSSQDDLEEVDSDEKTNEELAKTREFQRRASCMEQPENLLGNGLTVEKLEKYCANIVINSDESTTDEDRESDESDYKRHARNLL